MVLNEETANKIAENLLQIKAIKLNPSEPFTWASGLRSPIYCDNRVTLSYPALRSLIKEKLTAAVKEKLGLPDMIAGVATAGIPQGVLVAQELGLPFIYVRSAKKSHGLTNQIEGHYETGKTVVVVEDLVSTGKSSLATVDALREAGLDVKGMIAIFTYGLEVAGKNFSEKDCELITLSDYDHMISRAVETGYVKEEEKATLMNWRKDPQAWSDSFQND
jgi:orotate phosphoribosyltransferase